MTRTPRPTSEPSGILIHAAVWPQYRWAEYWTEAQLYAKCHLDLYSRLATIDRGRTFWRSVPFFRRELGPHLAQSPWAEAYLYTKWHLNLSSNLATTDICQNWGGCGRLGEGELGSYLTQYVRGHAYLCAKFHFDISNRFAAIHQRYRPTDGQTDRQTDRQRSDSIRRTVLRTVAQESLVYRVSQTTVFCVCMFALRWSTDYCTV